MTQNKPAKINTHINELIKRNQLNLAINCILKEVPAHKPATRKSLLLIQKKITELTKSLANNQINSKDFLIHENRIKKELKDVIKGLGSKLNSFYVTERIERDYPLLEKSNKKILKLDWAAWIGILIAVVGTIFGALSYYNDRGLIKPVVNVEKPSKQDDECADFSPANFDSSKLYILVTRFEDFSTHIRKECYGEGIITLIEKIKKKQNLPIEYCYNHEEAPNQKSEATKLLKRYNADIIIWGKLRNAKENCSSDGFCLKFNTSDTLIQYAGGGVLEETDTEYQKNISIQEIEEGIISMGVEKFESWLLEMSNLKIGKHKVEFYRISDEWPLSKQALEYHERGIMYANLHLYANAESDFSKSINVHLKLTDKNIITHDQIPIYLNRANTRLLQNKYIECISDIDKVVNFFDGAFNPKYGDYGKLLMAVTSIDSSKYSEIIMMRAFAKYNIGKHQESIADCNKAIGLNPKSSKLYNSLGIINAKIGNYFEAVNAMSKAISLEPNNPGYYANRGKMRLQMKKYRKALYDFEIAIRLGVEDDQLYINKLQANVQLGRYEEALKDINVALKINPKIEYLGVRGGILYYLKDYSSALKDLNSSVNLIPGYDLFSIRADILIKQKKYVESIEECNRALNMYKDNPFASLVRAEALYPSGQDHLEKGLTLAYLTAQKTNGRQNKTSPPECWGDVWGCCWMATKRPEPASVLCNSRLIDGRVSILVATLAGKPG